MDKNDPDFKKIKRRVYQGNGVACWEGCVGWNVYDRFYIGKTEFVVIQYQGYLMHCDHEDPGCQYEPCDELYACFYGLEKKAKPFRTPGEAFNWAIDQVKRPADGCYVRNRAVPQDNKRVEQSETLERTEAFA